MTKKIKTLDVKERILVVARELFVKNGYNGTSVRDIATASDTNVAHIKYYFASKYNLFEIIFDEAFGILVKRVFLTVGSDKPFFEMIEAWIDVYYEVLVEYPQIPIFILNEINHSPEELINKIKKRNPEEVFSALAKKVENEIEKGTIRETPPIHFILTVVSLCVFPFIFGGLAIKAADKSMFDYHEVLKNHKLYITDFVLHALKP